MAYPNIIYLVEGKYWDVQLAQYVDEPDSTKKVITLYSDGFPATEEYLASTLRFYNFPLGQFETGSGEESDKSIEEKLNELILEVTSLKSQLNTFQTTVSTLSASLSEEAINEGN